jgi:hypothetical protein
MALYFFDFSDTANSYPDEDGTELQHLDAAKDQAVTALLEMSSEMLPGGAFRELVCKVRDDRTRELMKVAIRFELHTI